MTKATVRPSEGGESSHDTPETRSGQEIQRAKLLGTMEAARYVGLGYNTFNDEVKAGRGPAFVAIGRIRRYRPEALDQWLKDREKASARRRMRALR